MSTQTLVRLTSGVCAMLMTLLPVVSSSCETVKYAMDLRSCFKINLPGLDQEVRIDQRDTIVETSLGMEMEGILDDPNRVCSKKDTFVNLFDCIGGLNVKCSEEEDIKYLPNATLTKQGIDYFCQQIQGINVQCYNDSYSNVFSCVKKLSTEYVKPADTTAQKACLTVDITHDCINANVKCDEKTRDLLLKFQDVYRKPSDCPAPARSDRKTYTDISGGGTVFSPLSNIFCFCLSVFVTMILQGY